MRTSHGGAPARRLSVRGYSIQLVAFPPVPARVSCGGRIERDDTESIAPVRRARLLRDPSLRLRAFRGDLQGAGNRELGEGHRAAGGIRTHILVAVLRPVSGEGRGSSRVGPGLGQRAPGDTGDGGAPLRGWSPRQG